MRERQPFDATDSSDLLADHLRKEVGSIGMKLLQDPLYLSLNLQQRVESIVGGMLTGVVGIVCAHIDERGHAEIIEYMADYLPQALEQAQAISKGQLQ